MTALWILGILCLILLVICLLRLGVLVDYDGALTVRASVGPVRIQVLPKKEPGKPKKTKKTSSARGKAGGQKQQEDRAETPEPKSRPVFPKLTFADIRSAVTALWPPLKKALGRTRRGIRIDPLQASLVLGGREDPAAAAENYGYASAAVWTVMPMLERLLDIPDPSIHIGIDFEREETMIALQTGVSIRIGTLLAVALQVGIPAVKWYLRFQKQHKQAAEQDPPQTEPAQQRPAA